MAGDIIIPKKTVSSFMTGFAVAVIALFVLGGALAATVYYIGASNNINAGGGTVTNLGTPVGSSDAATKGYVDAAGSSFNGHYATVSGTYRAATATCNAGTVIIEAASYCADPNACDSMTTPNPSCYGQTSCSQGSYNSNFASVGIVCGK